MGDTAMSLTCQYGLLDTAACLLSNGAKIHTYSYSTFANRAGLSQLMQATIAGPPELVQLLIDAKADVNHEAKPTLAKVTKMVGKALMQVRPDAILTHLLHGSGQRTALMLASMMGNAGAVVKLLEAGADEEAKNWNGDDALDHVKKYSRAPKIVKVLSKRKGF